MAELHFSHEVSKIALIVREVLSRGENLLLALRGPLGAGKTTFTKELLDELGFESSQVQSPTFLKLLEYEVKGQGLVLHLDGYRIDEPGDYEKLGLESYAERARLWIVEWPEALLAYLEQNEFLRKYLGLERCVDVAIDASHSLSFSESCVSNRSAKN
jgi:tRNA threonylcarbamoyladenosine biosynthesis protein TsaE